MPGDSLMSGAENPPRRSSFADCSATEDRGGSRHGQSGGAVMRLRRTSAPQVRGAILGGKSGLFASQGATGESGKVRQRDVARCNMRESQGAKLPCCTLRSSAMAGYDVRVSHPAIYF